MNVQTYHQPICADLISQIELDTMKEFALGDISDDMVSISVAAGVIWAYYTYNSRSGIDEVKASYMSQRLAS